MLNKEKVKQLNFYETSVILTYSIISHSPTWGNLEDSSLHSWCKLMLSNRPYSPKIVIVSYDLSVGSLKDP